MTYPQVPRAGQPAPLHLQITADSGFGKTVQVGLCDEFFDMILLITVGDLVSQGVELCVLETDGSFSFFTHGDQDERDGAPDNDSIA